MHSIENIIKPLSYKLDIKSYNINESSLNFSLIKDSVQLGSGVKIEKKVDICVPSQTEPSFCLVCLWVTGGTAGNRWDREGLVKEKTLYIMLRCKDETLSLGRGLFIKGSKIYEQE